MKGELEEGRLSVFTDDVDNDIFVQTAYNIGRTVDGARYVRSYDGHFIIGE